MLAVLPNPSSGPALRLRLPMQIDGRASLTLYNVRGQRVRTLLSDERASGELELTWDGTDDAGGRVASGTYWCRLDYEDWSETEKLLLVR